MTLSATLGVTDFSKNENKAFLKKDRDVSEIMGRVYWGI